MHYYQFNISDYRSDTGHLSFSEHGIYRALLDTYYLNEKPLTGDLKKLMRTHCVSTSHDKESLENILEDFFVLTDEGYKHKRCRDELNKIYTKSDKARASANLRWQKDKEIKDKENIDANALRMHCEQDANGMLPNNLLPNNTIPNNKKKSTKEKAKAFSPNSAQWQDWNWPSQPEQQIFKDWLAMRRKNKHTISITSFKNLSKEFIKAVEHGMTLDSCLTKCESKGWRGFKLDWYMNDERGDQNERHQQPAKQIQQRKLTPVERVQLSIDKERDRQAAHEQHERSVANASGYISGSVHEQEWGSSVENMDRVFEGDFTRSNGASGNEA